MGEWSKKVGEYGEGIVEKFLSIVGWSNPSKGLTILCSMSNGEHKNQKNDSVKTHGIDFLYSYMNPLVDGQLKNVIISSKYSMSKYPNSPTQQFKWYMTDLINTMECFDDSDIKTEILEPFSCSNIDDVGVLFWLNGDNNSNDDLINNVSSTRFDILRNATVYIVDNKRIGFILEVMKYIKTLSSTFRYSFYYPSTGQNVNPQNRANTGSILPVEYLNTSVIPIKLESINNSKETCLFLATIDNFEKDTFMRLMGLAKDLGTNLVGQVIIGFPDYKELEHKIVVSTSKQGFQDVDFTKTISVINYINPLHAL